MQKLSASWTIVFAAMLLLCFCLIADRQISLSKLRFSQRLAAPDAYNAFKQIFIDYNSKDFREKRIVCDAQVIGLSSSHEATISNEDEQISIELGSGHYHFGYIARRVRVEISGEWRDCIFLYCYEEGYPFLLLQIFSGADVLYSSEDFWTVSLLRVTTFRTFAFENSASR